MAGNHLDSTKTERSTLMTHLIKRFAALLLGGMFAVTAVSFGDFLTCNTNDGARIEEARGQKPRRPR